MPKRKTIEDVIKQFESKGLKLFNPIQYKNKKTHMDCFDEYGYKYSLTYDCINDKRTKKFEPIGNFNPYSIDNINNFIKINNGKCKLLTNKYESSRKNIRLKCECGNIYDTNLQHFISNKKFTCNSCAYLNSSKLRATNIDDLYNEILEYGYILISGNRKHKIIIEDKFGYRYKTSVYNLKNRKDVCNKFSKKNPNTVHNICNYLKINKIPVKLLDETERQIEIRKEYLNFVCSECGNTYKALWGEVAYEYNNRGKRTRCDKCNKRQSNLELYIENYLKYKNIKFIKQKRFDECRNKKPLPFDFYLKKYNTILEINGRQHYYENTMFEQPLEERKRIDNIKKKFCIENNINYIEIPFWKIYNCSEEKESYKNIINNILSQK